MQGIHTRQEKNDYALRVEANRKEDTSFALSREGKGRQ